MVSKDFRSLTAQDISNILYVLIKDKHNMKVVDDDTKMYIILPKDFNETEQAKKIFKERPVHEPCLTTGKWKDGDVSDLT